MSNLYTQNYVNSLQREYATGNALEHAYRPALKTYLEALLKDVHAVNDPKRQACGAPDYIVSKLRKGEAIDVGYIEAKDITQSLDKTEKTDQMGRYLKSLDNLILTDYMEFRFFKMGQKVATIRIAELDNFFTQTPKIKAFPENFHILESLLNEFVEFKGQTIKSASTLAEKMALKAQLMRDVFHNVLNDETNESTLKEQHEAFKQILIHDMSIEQFADVYAQTICYGLFTARLHDTTLEEFTRKEARELIPRSNPFLRRLFDYVCGVELDDRVVWIVDALCEVYRASDVKSILTNFGKTSGRNDPIIHFYETFLGAYDAKLRKARGVWYTPEPVVNFIVRAIDEVLETHFGLSEGLADTSMVEVDIDTHDKGKTKSIKTKVHKVQLLDVAAGTGTFTAETIKQIHAKFIGLEGMWSSYVEEHLLPRVHGFEILMASYAMCHLKIDLLLSELGYKPKDANKPPRLGVYLTNSLEEYHTDTGSLFASWLAKEANEANRIKRDLPIMVAYGNPPYSGESMNKGEYIMGLMEAYKQEPSGGKLQERNSKWINDDYVKFMRLAESFIQKNGFGVMAFITNHAYLDNPTFRGMRFHLLNSFDELYLVDLHGNAKKKEVSPDGTPDSNVFDIQQGVSIIIAVKHKKEKKQLATVKHLDLFGSRNSKYQKLWELNLKSKGFSKLSPSQPNYLLIPFNNDLAKPYKKGFGVQEFFSVNSVGIVTSRDEFVIDTNENELSKRIQDFLNLQNSDLEVKHKYTLSENQKWKVAQTRNTAKFEDADIVKINYRPFDVQHIYYNEAFIERSRKSVMQHFLNGENWGLNVCKQQKAFDFQHVFIHKNIVESSLVSNKTSEISYAFPLYLYPSQSDTQKDAFATKRTPNLDMKIVQEIADKLSLKFISDHEDKKLNDKTSFSPLDLLDYIYAILHSPSYRETYKEFLKIDFPRIPYPSTETFWGLVEKGGLLRNLHLLEGEAFKKPTVTFPIQGDNIIEKPKFDDGKVYINDTQYFEGVSEIAWNFYIGGYQPAQKWLKDRKSRELKFEDIKHYQKIIIALCETHKIMQEINELWQPE